MKPSEYVDADICASGRNKILGGGETEFRGNIIQGDGVYRTTDGGATWTHLGLKDSQAVARLRIHPANCDTVYAAVLGPSYNDHTERGVFKSTDGGKTWKKTLYRNEKSGAVDLSMDPKNPNVLFAAVWEAFRTPWSMSSGGISGSVVSRRPRVLSYCSSPSVSSRAT